MNEHPNPPPRKPSESSERESCGAAPSRRAGELPRFKLILHSAPKPDMMQTVRAVMEVTRLCRAEATHKMWEAYHFGRSQLLQTFRERAELYVEQFAERGLTVTIEPI